MIMPSKKTCFLVTLFFVAALNAQPQEVPIAPAWLHGFWAAKWISDPKAAGDAFGVYHFRKTFALEAQPGSFIVHVSADNRYRLFVNGKAVAQGPARSDLANWNFETVDLAPYLHKGQNVIAATVWNFAEYRPYAQISFQTAFILQGNSSQEQALNTGPTWKVVQDSGYSPRPMDKVQLQTYIVTADGEKVDGNKYIWGFESPSYDDRTWPWATELWYPAKSRTFGTDGNWMLVPRSIPEPEETEQRFLSVRRSDVPGVPASSLAVFLAGQSPLIIPAGTRATLLLDQGALTNAYPRLSVSGGRGAHLLLSYAEALVDAQRVKGNRDSIDGKKLIGLSDEYVSDGGDKRMYSPLFFRTFRYLQLDIETASQPLTINDLHSLFTGYPFQENAYFHSSEDSLQDIWRVGWHTARLCAVDTYFDCPYYEQLQYVGDTRIQALISLYVSGDARLMRKAIDDLSHSFIPDGLTQSRYPSRDMQVIPTFSLWWVCMIHDYWMNRQDDAFVVAQLAGIERVLAWYQARLGPNGMLGPLSWWQFVDWSWPWVDSIRVGGVPPGADSGGSSIISLQYAYTLQRAAKLMQKFGHPQLADQYIRQAQALTEKTYAQCWDNQKNLLADDPSKKQFSQHANIMAILSDALPPQKQKQVLQKILVDQQITPCTYYFKFYLFEALKKVQLGDQFLGLLQPWFDMIHIGLTTFAENPEPTRSDCHAWSASPVYELLSLVCGVQSDAPGFAKVLVEPYLGNLRWVEAKVPCPQGNILVHITQGSGKVQATIELPAHMSGSFRWHGTNLPLQSGKQTLSLNL
jgi:alpha-L-rhamnosidase